MEVVAGLWVTMGLPALALAPLAVERGRSPWWGLLALGSFFGLVIGLLALFLQEPGNQPERLAYARFQRGEISADEYERIRSQLASRPQF